jgi:hypothetical protein
VWHVWLHMWYNYLLREVQDRNVTPTHTSVQYQTRQMQEHEHKLHMDNFTFVITLIKNKINCCCTLKTVQHLQSHNDADKTIFGPLLGVRKPSGEMRCTCTDEYEWPTGIW